MKQGGPWGAGGSPRRPGCRAPLLKANSRAVARRRDQQRTGRRGEVYEYCVGQAVGGVGIVAIDGASATRVAELANRRAARSVSPAAAPSMLVVIACTPHRLPCRLDRDFCFRSGRTVFHRRFKQAASSDPVGDNDSSDHSRRGHQCHSNRCYFPKLPTVLLPVRSEPHSDGISYPTPSTVDRPHRAETANSIGGRVLSRCPKTKRPPRMAGSCQTGAAMDFAPTYSIRSATPLLTEPGSGPSSGGARTTRQMNESKLDRLAGTPLA